MAPYYYNDFQFNFEDFASGGEALRIILIVYIAVVAAVLLLYCLPQYIMLSISYTCIGKRRGVKASWLAWIPIARYWTIGAIVDEYDTRHLGVKRRFRIVMLIFAIVYLVSLFALLAGILSLIPMIISAIRGNAGDALANIMTFALGLEYGISGLVYSGIILTALYYVALYKIFESLSPKNAILFLALSITIPLFMPICLLVIRKKGYCKEEDTKEEIPEAVRIGWYES